MIEWTPLIPSVKSTPIGSGAKRRRLEPGMLREERRLIAIDRHRIGRIRDNA